MRSGFSYILDKSNNNNYSSGDVLRSIDKIDLKVFSARVVDIILDDTHPNFNRYGGWNGIGTIQFEPINSPSQNKANNPIALPFYPQFKSYPLVNEIVLLFYLPDKNIGRQDTSKIYYYLNTISIWNHPHHNAYPNLFDGFNDDEQQRDYQAIEGGSVRRVTDNSTEINLQGNNPSGGTFTERTNIHPILPFVGDNIIEGRFGNSIRLGSTVNSKSVYNNNWSSEGKEGDPILIIRNGQPLNSTDEGWIPLVENINEDLSSIYITSTQKIPIEVSSKNYTGIRNQFLPTFPKSYNKSQIILSSGRLLFNSTLDSILLSSKKTISLSAINDIGISSRGNVSLTGDEIRLGSNSAGQSLILGDNFIEQFNILLNSLNKLCEALLNEPNLKSTPLIAQGVINVIDNMKNLSESGDFLSKITKTL